MKLHTLYKLNNNNKVQVYNIEVIGDTYNVTFGEVNGKQQQKSTKCYEKNVGKSNYINAEEQAIKEADALLTKKMKAGYTTEESGLTSIELPMKITTYEKHGHTLDYPVYLSHKLDGYNAEYRLIDGKAVLLSRGGTLLPPIPHLEDGVMTMFDRLNTTRLVGELYIHGVDLELISSAVKKPKELSKQLTFNIFDVPLLDKVYNERLSTAGVLCENIKPKPYAVNVVELQIVYDEAELRDYFNEAIILGYEGIVIAQRDVEYKYNTRSNKMMKLKPKPRDEFLIKSYKLDKNGLAVFECLGMKHSLFSAVPKGTHEYRASINPDEWLGKYATIEYERVSAKGVPLKPILIGLRDKSNGTFE